MGDRQTRPRRTRQGRKGRGQGRRQEKRRGWKARPRLESRAVGSYRQLPFKPAWAVTIHKSQGRTFRHARIELGPRPLFAAGQAYVAFSRLTGLDGLSLDRPLAARDVIADHAANLFLERMGRPGPAVQDTLF